MLPTGILVMCGNTTLPVRSWASLPTFPKLASAKACRGSCEASFSQLSVTLICYRTQPIERQCYRNSEAVRSVFCKWPSLSGSVQSDFPRLSLPSNRVHIPLSRNSDARSLPVFSGPWERWMSSTPRESEQQRMNSHVTSKADGHDSNEVGTDEVERVLLAQHRVDTGLEKDRQVEKEQMTSVAFKQWAVNKVKKGGLSTLPMIEEMRRNFAPHAPLFDPSSEREPSELDRKEVRKSSTNSGGIRHQVGLHGSRSVVRGTRPEKLVARSSERFESGPRNFKDASNVLQPIVVKRKTSLPINWNWVGGVVVLVDKPEGWTSFAVCSKLRYMLRIQKVGHAGTLDPMATGLLIICLGQATKAVDSYQAMTKVYSGTLRLGELTPSLDSHTEVSDVLPWEHITDEELDRARKGFIGDIMQRPPMYSAIQINGERMYKKARRGEEIEIPPRLVSVIDFQLERSSENRQEVHFRVTCSKGTYIRSLCRDLADAVGSHAHLTSLRREKIGVYTVKDAWPILELVEKYAESTGIAPFKTKVRGDDTNV